MNHDRASSQTATASVAIHQLDDFEDFRYIFGQWGGQFQQVSRGDFKGLARIYSGLSLRAFEVETGQAIFTRGLDESSFAIFIPITPMSETVLWRGRQLSTGQMLVKGPRVEYYNKTSRGSVIKALLVPARTIEALIGSKADFLVGKNAFSSVALTPTRGAVDRFEASLDALYVQPGPVSGPTARSMEKRCLDNLADCLLRRDAQPRIRVLHTKRLDLLNRSLQFMGERLEKGMTATELYENLGVSERSVRRMFKQAFGAGPIVFFRLMRMNAVKQELKSNRENNRTVASIASRYGFTRLGAFAVDYHTLFGERPSETLQVRGWPGIQKSRSK